jgi:Na+-transporting NADH:ubiquinone oxidoreductase subunit B
VKIQKQHAMRNVLKGMAPLCAAAVYFYGWRFAAVLAVVAAAGLAGEYLMSRKYNLPVTESLFVSVVLFSLSLPPTIPLWIAAVGILFGVVFGKMVFGGFGRNIFNPAISARAFIYISFGGPLTGNFVPPVPGTLSWFPGGFGYWLSPLDSVSNATPLVTGAGNLVHMIMGNVAGSFGETSAVLILIGGLYIIYKKAANWRLVVSSLVSFLVLQTIFWLSGAGDAFNPLYALAGGSFLLGAFFMITDPVSASQTTDAGRWIYGALFGALTVLIRNFSIWPAAITFAILLSNMFAPLIDYYMKEWKKRQKEAAKKGASA